MANLSDVTSRGYVAPGTIVAFGRAGATTGYLPCDGAAVSRATYSILFAKIGVTFGPGDGSTTFNLPNSSGLFFRGAGSQTFASKTFDGGAIGNRQADATAINGLLASTVSTPSLTITPVDLTHTHTYNDLTTTNFVTSHEAFGATPGSNSILNPANATESDTTASALGSHAHTVTPSIASVVTTLSSANPVVKPGSLTVAYYIKV